MDVRGPADGQDVPPKVSRTRLELLRDELRDGSHPQSHASPFVAHATAPEILQLVQKLRELPEVRGELVAEAAVKLREGQLSTRESAERTAEAILRTLARE